jgi:hypothetical protein
VISTKVVPRFDGTGDGYWWLIQLDRFLEANTWLCEERKVRWVTTFAFSGDAFNWWFNWRQGTLNITWEKFERAFIKKFIPDLWEMMEAAEDEEQESHGYVLNKNAEDDADSKEDGNNIDHKSLQKFDMLTPTPEPRKTINALASGKEGVASLQTEIEAYNTEISVTKNQRVVVDILSSSDSPSPGSPFKAFPKPKPPDPPIVESQPSESWNSDQLATILPRRTPSCLDRPAAAPPDPEPPDVASGWRQVIVTKGEKDLETPRAKREFTKVGNHFNLTGQTQVNVGLFSEILNIWAGLKQIEWAQVTNILLACNFLIRRVVQQGESIYALNCIFWMSGNYAAQVGKQCDPYVLLIFKYFNYKDLLDEDETMNARLEVALHDFLKAALAEMYVEYGSVFWACETFYEFNRKYVGFIFCRVVIGWCERYGVYVSIFENLGNTWAKKCQPNKAVCVLHLSLFSHNGHIEKELHDFRMNKGHMVLQRRPLVRDQLEVIQLNWHASRSWKFKSWPGKEYTIAENWTKLTIHDVLFYLKFLRAIQAVRVVTDTKDAIVRLLYSFECVWYPIFTPQHGNYQFQDGQVGRITSFHLYLMDMSINHDTYESLFQYTNYHSAHQQHKSLVNEFCLSALVAINFVNAATFVLLLEKVIKNVAVMKLGIIVDATLDRVEASNKFIIYLDRVMMDDGLVPLQVEIGNNMPHKFRKVEIVWSGQIFEASLSNSQQWDPGGSVSKCNDNCSKGIITRWRREDVHEVSVEGDKKYEHGACIQIGTYDRALWNAMILGYGRRNSALCYNMMAWHSSFFMWQQDSRDSREFNFPMLVPVNEICWRMFFTFHGLLNFVFDRGKVVSI